MGLVDRPSIRRLPESHPIEQFGRFVDHSISAPVSGIIISKDVTKQRDNRNHARIPTCADIPLAVADVKTIARCEVEHFGGMQQRHRVGLSSLDGIAGDNTCGAGAEAEGPKQGTREPARLIGYDAPRQFPLPEAHQHFAESRHKTALPAQVFGIDFEEAFDEGLLFFWLKLVAEAESNQSARTIGNKRPNGIEIELFPLCFGEQQVERGSHIGRGIDKRSVEINQNRPGPSRCIQNQPSVPWCRQCMR